MSPFLSFALMFALSGAPPEGPTGEPGEGQVELVKRSFITAKKTAPRGPWTGTRLTELVRRIELECYAPARVRKPTAAGELTIKATLGRNARLSGVSVTAKKGATLDATIRACVRRLVTEARLDMRPLPPIEHDPELPGAYYDPPMDPPTRAELPMKITLDLRLTAPALAEPEPTPTPIGPIGPVPPDEKVCKGPSPAGCKKSGCREGFVCDTKVRCVPSSCGCSRDSGAWVCTADCGGGVCVPAGAKGPPW